MEVLGFVMILLGVHGGLFLTAYAIVKAAAPKGPKQ